MFSRLRRAILLPGLLALVAAVAASSRAVQANCMMSGNSVAGSWIRYSHTGNCFLTYTYLNSWYTVYWNCGQWSAEDDSYKASLGNGVGTHVDQWSNPGPYSQAMLQADGNWVLYDGAGGWSWETYTGGFYNSYLNLGDDGHLALFYGGTPSSCSGGTVVWSTSS